MRVVGSYCMEGNSLATANINKPLNILKAFVRLYNLINYDRCLANHSVVENFIIPRVSAQVIIESQSVDFVKRNSSFKNLVFQFEPKMYNSLNQNFGEYMKTEPS